MNIGALEIKLVDDWKEVCQKGTVMWSAALAIVYATVGEILPLISEHWFELSPFILKFFPTADQALGPFLGAVLTIIVRLMQIRKATT